MVEFTTDTAFDLPEWRAKLAILHEEARAGCGLIYELYAVRFSDAVDRLVAQLPAEHREMAMGLALEDDVYVQADERDLSSDDPDYPLCCHGIDPYCCPAGCGDL